MLLGHNEAISYSRNYSNRVQMTDGIGRNIYVLRDCIMLINCIGCISGNGRGNI